MHLCINPPTLVGGSLVGGSKENQWFEAPEFAQQLTGEEVYQSYDLSGYIQNVKGAKVEPETDQYRGPYTEFVDLDQEPREEMTVAVNGDWDMMPRKPILQTGNRDTYKAVLDTLLEEKGLYGADIDILQNYRVDFEGDGVDEVVLYAENKENKDQYWRYDERKGCFSILVLRKIVNGTVKNFVLQWDVHPEDTDPEGLNRRIRYLFPIVGILDVNGDGKMELVSTWKYYEGTSFEVYEIFSNEVRSVVANGYGA